VSALVSIEVGPARRTVTGVLESESLNTNRAQDDVGILNCLNKSSELDVSTGVEPSKILDA
jgi:hypothetical protein